MQGNAERRGKSLSRQLEGWIKKAPGEFPNNLTSKFVIENVTPDFVLLLEQAAAQTGYKVAVEVRIDEGFTYSQRKHGMADTEVTRMKHGCIGVSITKPSDQVHYAPFWVALIALEASSRAQEA